MSDKLPYPRDPVQAGDRGSIMDLIHLARNAFFPTRGDRKGVMERLKDLEERVARLEQRP